MALLFRWSNYMLPSLLSNLIVRFRSSCSVTECDMNRCCFIKTYSAVNSWPLAEDDRLIQVRLSEKSRNAKQSSWYRQFSWPELGRGIFVTQVSDVFKGHYALILTWSKSTKVKAFYIVHSFPRSRFQGNRIPPLPHKGGNWNMTPQKRTATIKLPYFTGEVWQFYGRLKPARWSFRASSYWPETFFQVRHLFWLFNMTDVYLVDWCFNKAGAIYSKRKQSRPQSNKTNVLRNFPDLLM